MSGLSDACCCQQATMMGSNCVSSFGSLSDGLYPYARGARFGTPGGGTMRASGCISSYRSTPYENTSHRSVYAAVR
eukprot:scaffold47547_cov34-Tisochrysis_lutea.AAC.2